MWPDLLAEGLRDQGPRMMAAAADPAAAPPLLNYAYGGATACPQAGGLGAAAPHLLEQVTSYLRDWESAGPSVGIANDPDAYGVRPRRAQEVPPCSPGPDSSADGAKGAHKAGCQGKPLGSGPPGGVDACLPGLLRSVSPRPDAGCHQADSSQPRGGSEGAAGAVGRRVLRGAGPRSTASSTGSSSTGSSSSGSRTAIPCNCGTAQQQPPPRRVFNIWIGHNDFLDPSLNWTDPRVGVGLARNVTASITAAAELLFLHSISTSIPASDEADGAGGGGVGPGPGGPRTAPADTSAPAVAASAPPVFTPFRASSSRSGLLRGSGTSSLRAAAAAGRAESDPAAADRGSSLGSRAAAAGTSAGSAAGSAGGRHGADALVLWTLAPLENTPAVPTVVRQQAKGVVADINRALERSLRELAVRHPDGPAAYVFDAHAALSSHGRRLGMRDGSGGAACLRFNKASGASSPAAADLELVLLAASAHRCPRPEEFLWYDGSHLTSAAHGRLLAAPLLAGLQARHGRR
ncbi:hypothetical protein GPECTOR_26g535 [Gonium pectorale]|uniref:Uncharacterized protein n=1 Tax=Gonium pectorale TaxID=33097 RepID=A0A150GFL5_GONPE|nr:hypothetical protein GPECTOR_26g535 [Gonium pectorale]|eukprot:KXZ48632.1 hypothetical protein GPECTOR_26g535 [Gonium pectorale]